MTKQIKRSGDMGPRGSLELLWDDEGDIHVIVVDDENGAVTCVEFCLSGSRSPRTHVALRRLFEAMEEDGRRIFMPDQQTPAQAETSWRIGDLWAVQHGPNVPNLFWWRVTSVDPYRDELLDPSSLDAPDIRAAVEAFVERHECGGGAR